MILNTCLLKHLASMKPQNKPLEILLAINTLQSSILKKLDRGLSSHGISFKEFLILHHLSQAPESSMKRIDLAGLVFLSASGVTRILIPMEKLRLVKRESNPRDARVSLVNLTKTGLQVYQDSLKTIERDADFLIQSDAPEKILEWIGKIHVK